MSKETKHENVKGYKAHEKAHEKAREVHKDHGCDGCRQEPIIGKMYRCEYCVDVDFCEYCVKTKAHNNLHTFVRVKLL